MPHEATPLNPHSRIFKDVREILRIAFYEPEDDGECPGMPSLPSENMERLKNKLTQMTRKELQSLLEIIKDEAGQFWRQKLVCYAIAALSFSYTIVSLTLIEMTSKLPPAVPITGLVVGLPLGSAFIGLGLYKPAKREEIANKVVKEITQAISECRY